MHNLLCRSVERTRLNGIYLVEFSIGSKDFTTNLKLKETVFKFCIVHLFTSYPWSTFRQGYFPRNEGKRNTTDAKLTGAIIKVCEKRKN